MMANFHDYSWGTPQPTSGMLDQEMVADNKPSERLRMRLWCFVYVSLCIFGVSCCSELFELFG
jgi:hypothetical protein